MYKALSLKLRGDVFKQVEEISKSAHIPRNAYINRALDFYNSYNKRKLLRKQLHAESQLVREDSLEILHEFEEVKDDLIQ
jgi:hypothetical protein